MVASKKGTKKSIEELISKVEVIVGTIPSEALVKSSLEGYKMDISTIRYFVSECHNNNEKILTELNKLKMYKCDDPNKLITHDDIDKVIYKEQDDHVFKLVDAIISRNKTKSIELYERLKEKEDSTAIVAAIASKIRMLYSIKVLKDKKYKPNDIATILMVKPAAISMSLEYCDNFASNKLLSLLYELSEIDYKSKTSTNDLDLQFRLFLMSI
jgi:DNA polymerase III delta subunit